MEEDKPKPDVILFTEPRKCNFCPKTFLYPNLMKAHMKTHAGENQYICGVCKKEFRTECYLKAHSLRCYQGNQPNRQIARRRTGIPCDEEPRIVNPELSYKELSSDTESESDSRQTTMNYKKKLFMCQLCKRGFISRCHLKIHMRIHTGSKPFSCPVCEKSFTQKIHMQRHQQIHSRQNKNYSRGREAKTRPGEKILQRKENQLQKQHTCPLCKIGFLCWESLKRHYFVEHGQRLTINDFLMPMPNIPSRKLQTDEDPKEKIPKSNESADPFSQVGANPSQHPTSNCAPKSFVCYYCKTGYIDPNGAKLHFKIHRGGNPYLCNHCQESFSAKPALKSHQQDCSFKGGLYVCFHCKKRFVFRGDLESHMIMHAGEKLYSCTVCSEEFHAAPELNAHYILCHASESETSSEMCGTATNKDFVEKPHSADLRTGETASISDMKEQSIENHPPLHLHPRRRGRPRKNFNNHLTMVSKTDQTPPSSESNDTNSRDMFVSSNLQTTSKVHKGSSPFQCPVCKKKFSQSGYVKVHLRIHTGEKPFKCNQCDFAFAQKISLDYHTRKFHTGEKRTFVHRRYKPSGPEIPSRVRERTKRLLIRKDYSEYHMENNPVTKPLGDMPIENSRGRKRGRPRKNFTSSKVQNGCSRFQCPICKKSFSQSGYVKVHLRLHTGEKPFKCNQCDFAFAHKISLDYHTRKFHTGVKHKVVHKNYKGSCPAIPRREKSRRLQTRKDYSEYHTEDKTETMPLKLNCTTDEQTQDYPILKSWACDYCKTGFIVSTTTTKDLHNNTHHTEEKPWVCNYCQESFSSFNDLRLHRRNSHPGNLHYKCNQCAKRFYTPTSLEIHLYIHTGEKPFRCTVCGKCFNQLSNLKTHEISHIRKRSYEYECKKCNQRFISSSCLEKHSKSQCQIDIPEKQKICGKVVSTLDHDTLDVGLMYKKCTNTENDEPTIRSSNTSKTISEPMDISTDSIDISKKERALQWASFLNVFNAKIANK